MNEASQGEADERPVLRTVGLGEERVRQYIQGQEAFENRQGELDFW